MEQDSGVDHLSFDRALDKRPTAVNKYVRKNSMWHSNCIVCMLHCCILFTVGCVFSIETLTSAGHVFCVTSAVGLFL